MPTTVATTMIWSRSHATAFSCLDCPPNSELGIDTIDRVYDTVARWRWANEKRHAKQASMWVATQDLPRSAAHLFYIRLNQILDQYDFDGYVEALVLQFYADDGRPGLPPGRYFRLLLIGYFGGQPAALRCMKSVICIGQCFGARGS